MVTFIQTRQVNWAFGCTAGSTDSPDFVNCQLIEFHTLTFDDFGDVGGLYATSCPAHRTRIPAYTHWHLFTYLTLVLLPFLYATMTTSFLLPHIPAALLHAWRTVPLPTRSWSVDLQLSFSLFWVEPSPVIGWSDPIYCAAQKANDGRSARRTAARICAHRGVVMLLRIVIFSYDWNVSEDVRISTARWPIPTYILYT